MGAGQTPGDTIGNGRATAILFAREGARVVAVDISPRMVAEARGLGADAVVNVRFMTSMLMQGAAELLVFGTAVKLEDE